MARTGKRGPRKEKKPLPEDNYLQEVQNELKKNKHRICETVCILLYFQITRDAVNKNQLLLTFLWILSCIQRNLCTLDQEDFLA